VLARREAVQARHFAAVQQSARLAARLGLLGVDAAPAGKVVTVRDLAALERLLERLDAANSAL